MTFIVSYTCLNQFSNQGDKCNVGDEQKNR